MKISDLKVKILNGSFDDQLSEIYYDLDKQRVRCSALCDLYCSSFGDSEGAVLISTPGRTEICGNHTDHNNGLIAAAAVNLDILAVAAPNTENRVNVASTKYPLDVVDLNNLSPADDEQANSCGIIRGVTAYLSENGYKIGGFNAATDNQVLKGSGLSSSAAFEVEIGNILNHLYNDGCIDPITLAIAGQYAENNYYGKPCGLLDQTTCAVGSFVTIDFRDNMHPKVESVPFDMDAMDLNLWVIDTGGNHTDLTDDYAAIPSEMFSVAGFFSKKTLREVDEKMFLDNICEIRKVCSDRAVLRAFHYFGENKRVVELISAVKANNCSAFVEIVNRSGQSSFMFNQNAYSPQNVKEQGISVAYAVADSMLDYHVNSFRLQGGGFAGTLQVFAKRGLEDIFISRCQMTFGADSCHHIFIRNKGTARII